MNSFDPRAVQLGRNIRRALRLARVKQRDLARHLDISNTTLQYWLNGRFVPDAVNLAEIARVSGTTPNHLLGFAGHGDLKKILRQEFNRILAEI